ncbi:DUF6894 family protein [Methylobacterium sp. A54F]
MAVRFHFDLENGEDTIRDEEGVEAVDLSEAMTEAASVIQDFRRELGARVPDRWTLAVRDETGAVVARLSV